MRSLSAWMKLAISFVLWVIKQHFSDDQRRRVLFQVLAKLLFCHNVFPNRCKTNFTNLLLLLFLLPYFLDSLASHCSQMKTSQPSPQLSHNSFLWKFYVFFSLFLHAFLGQWIPGESLGHDLQWECLLVPVGQPGLYAGDPGGPRVQRHHRAALCWDHQRHPLQKPGSQQATQ